MPLSEKQIKDIAQGAAKATLKDLEVFVREQVIDEEQAHQQYQNGAFLALTLGKAEAAKTLSSIANDESRHFEMLKALDASLSGKGGEYLAACSENGGGTAMALTEKEIREIANATADEVMERVYGMTDVVAHVMEHEVMGGARVINEATAKNPDIACKCFKFDGEEFCWKPGYLGLISSKKNPEQLANCKIKVPASTGAQERFARIKGAVAKATKEHEKKGGGLPEYWTAVGENLSAAGVTL